MSNIVFIYGLRDPRDKQIFYVGKTNDPKTRLAEHILEAGDTSKNIWIRSLKLRGLSPELVILEETTEERWSDAEKFWIAVGLADDWPLTNSAPGGGGRFTSGERCRALIQGYQSRGFFPGKTTDEITRMSDDEAINLFASEALNHLQELRIFLNRWLEPLEDGAF